MVTGRLLGQQRIAATLDGYQTLRAWAARWPDRRWAVEGAYGIGRVLAQHRAGLLPAQAGRGQGAQGGPAVPERRLSDAVYRCLLNDQVDQRLAVATN